MKTFTKEERLCSKRLLDLLFKNGSSFLLYPYRVSYLFVADEFEVPAQVVINVSKRRYKRAVDRNLIKRRTREAYRLQKQEELYAFLTNPEQKLLIALQFVGKQKYEFDFLQKKMQAALKKLRAKLSTDESN
jgi:ribonuclease P protein component